MWRAPTEQQKKANPERDMSPVQMIHQYLVQQLVPGVQLNQIAAIFVDHLNDRVRWPSQNLSSHQSYVLEACSESVTVDVLGWTSHIFFHASTEVYYGKLMLEIAPNLLKTFHKWEQTNWKFLFQIPRFLSEDLYAAKGQLVDDFAAYFKQTREQRGDASRFVKLAETELRACGLDNEEIARIQVLHHWAINGNSHKVTFWILAHLVHNPTLLDIIRREIQPGVIDDVPCERYLTESCPRLESIFYEVLRFYSDSTLLRQVLSPTIVGGKILRAGNRVMAPYRQLHYNQDVWGASAAEFDPDRFLRDKSLTRNPSFRPFGGGVNLCPGQYLAKKVVVAFVALTLSRFEVSLDQQRLVQAFPREDFGTPSIGTMSPMNEDRLILRLSPLQK
ncbi:hypothetical protein MMC22_007862 [Lobaria immixta]|nr:hypothetical protein [Lobaria immixta]